MTTKPKSTAAQLDLLAYRPVSRARPEAPSQKFGIGFSWPSTGGDRTIVALGTSGGEPAAQVVTGRSKIGFVYALKWLPVEIERDRQAILQEQQRDERAAQKARSEADRKSKPKATIADLRSAAVLRRLMRLNGVEDSRAAHIERLVALGWRVRESRRGRELTAPTGAFLTEGDITKTGMDYADRLVP